MYIPRSIEAKLRQAAGLFPSVLLTGARQAGKTTLARNVFPSHRYVSLDLPTVAEQAERDPERLFSDAPPPVIVDEVQYAPGLFRHLKRMIDERRDEKGLFVLTGSQHFTLMKGASESLAGRTSLLDIENLSHSDLLGEGLVEPDRDSLAHTMVRGFFPELWKLPDIPANDFYRSYLATYLERDVRQILNVVRLRDFERFVRSLAARSGTLLNKMQVAGEVGVSQKAVSDWLSVLEASGVITLLEPWYSNFGKRIVKTPKVYMNDTGLMCFLLATGEAELANSPFIGQVWETFVFSEIRKRNQLLDTPFNIWFYRDQRAREVDFVLESGGILNFLECRWSAAARIEDARVMEALRRELNQSSSSWTGGAMAIISPETKYHRISEDISVFSPVGIFTDWPLRPAS